MYISADLIVVIVMLILSISTLFVGIIRLSMIPKRDIIETSETNAKILIAIWTSCTYILFLVFYAFYVINKFHYTDWSYQEVIISILSVLPALFIFYNYFNLNNYFRRKLDLHEANISNYKRALISNVSEYLGLKRVPKVLISDYENISPFVFGRTSRKRFIAIPKNWELILSKSSRDNRDVRQSLEKLVFFHELSHIKHRDHVFMCWSYITLRTLKYWIISVLPIILAFFFLTEQVNFRFTFGPFLLGILYYLALHLISMSVSRRREYLADARASVLMAKKELKLATEPRIDCQNKSYLDQLLQWFSISSKKNLNTLSISESPKRFPKIAEKMVIKTFKGNNLMEKVLKVIEIIFCSHPKIKLRIERLKERFFIETNQNIISSGTAMWLGVMLALFYTVTQLLPFQLAFSLPKVSAFRYSAKLIYMIGKIFHFLLVISLPFIFYSSLRNVFKPNISFKEYLKLLLLRFVLVFIAYFYSNLLLYSILFLPKLGDFF